MNGTAGDEKQWNIRIKLFTIWDIVNTIDIEHLVTALRQLSTGHSAFESHKERMDHAAISNVCMALEKCQKPFMDMGFKTSSGMIYKFLDSARRNMDYGDWTGIQFSEKCLAVFSAIQCETMGVMCFKLDADNAAYFDKQAPFGKFVAAAFAECAEDISEAHQCVALERYTASMFHIGRAMEIVVKIVAKKMGVKTHRDEWQTYLNAMNEKIRKMPFNTPSQKAKRIPWSEVAGHLFNFKEAWRNPTFHAKKTYQRSEAIAALNNAGAFMDTVAKRILKVKA